MLPAPPGTLVADIQAGATHRYPLLKNPSLKVLETSPGILDLLSNERDQRGFKVGFTAQLAPSLRNPFSLLQWVSP